MRKYCIFELRRVRDERVERANALHGRVEILEQLSSDTCGDLRAVTKRKRILVSDDHAVSSFDGFNDRVPVVRRQAAQVDDLDANAFLFRLFRSNERTLDQRALRHDREVLSLANSPGLSKRNHEIVAGVSRLVVRLAIEVLVFEKQHRIVAANRRAQQSVCVERV